MNQKLSSSEEKTILDIQGTSSFSILQSIQLKFQMESNSCPPSSLPQIQYSPPLEWYIKIHNTHLKMSKMPCKNQKAEYVFPHNPMVKTRKKPIVFPTTEITHKRRQLNIPYIAHISQISPTAQSGLQYLCLQTMSCQANVQKRQGPFQLLYSCCSVLWGLLLTDISNPSISGKPMIC